MKCSLDNFENSGNSAKIGFSKKGDNISFSAIGSHADISRIMSIFNEVGKDVSVSAYVNLNEMALSGTKKIRNVKGSLNFKNGKVVGGACYGVIGEDTTLALTAKEIE
jgi:hypothetical protein